MIPFSCIFLAVNDLRRPRVVFSLNLCVNGRKSMEIRPSERTERKLSSDYFALYSYTCLNLWKEYNGLDARKTYLLILSRKNDWKEYNGPVGIRIELVFLILFIASPVFRGP